MNERPQRERRTSPPVVRVGWGNLYITYSICNVGMLWDETYEK